jgi:hypothetical protein
MSTEGSHARRAARTLAAVLLCIGAVSCAGTLTDPERFEVEGGSTSSPVGVGDGQAGAACKDVETMLLPARCALSGCHSAKDMSAGLDLESPGMRTRLTGRAATGGPGVLVDPGGDPQKSVLYLKLTPNPPFGSQMPLAGTKLAGSDLACVAAWIASPAAASDDAGAEAAGGG